MIVTVVKCEEFNGQKRDGSPNRGIKALVKFPDGCTAENVFIADDVIDPAKVVCGVQYDMYRSSAGFVNIFDTIT